VLQMLQTDPTMSSLNEVQQILAGSGMPSRNIPLRMKYGSGQEIKDVGNETSRTQLGPDALKPVPRVSPHFQDMPSEPYDPNQEPIMGPGYPEPIAQMIPQVLQMVMQNPQMLQGVMQQVAPMIQNTPGLLMRLASANPTQMPQDTEVQPMQTMPTLGSTDQEIEQDVPDASTKANSYYSNNRPSLTPMPRLTPDLLRQIQEQSTSPDDGEYDWKLEDAYETDPNVI
jgi:hypothetical protein